MAPPEPILSVARPLRDHGFHPLRVDRVVRETPEAVSAVLEVPSDLSDTFVYRSGQFCNVRVQIDDRPEMRCYSMSSSPALGEAMAVTVKRVPGGIVSNWINDHLRAGDTLDLAPPTGFFQLTDTSDDLVAFAAGSGITPVFSLLKTALATTERTVRLHYANRDQASVIFDAELRRLQQLHPERLVVVHSYDLEHGLLTPDTVTAFATIATAGAAAGEFYVCGPGPYMETVERGLCTLGVEADRIHIERFTPADLPVAAAPLPPEAVGGTRVDHRPRRPVRHDRPPAGDHHPSDRPTDGDVAALLLRVRQLRHLHGQAGRGIGLDVRQQRSHHRGGGGRLDPHLPVGADHIGCPRRLRHRRELRWGMHPWRTSSRSSSCSPTTPWP